MNTPNLQQMLAGDSIVVAPGAHDALTAKVVAQSGFSAVYMTGYGVAASYLGAPDVGLMTQTEMVTRAGNFVDAVSAANIPVIADADTGFGNAINVMRTVRLYEKAGVAALQLEDQVAPKKCGHMTGRQVSAPEEMVGKIKAAVAARTRQDLLIIARTDARTVHGIEEAVRRGKLYEEAGADILFIESPESIEEMKLITSSIKKPCLANMVEGGRTPLLTTAQLQELGFKLVIFPTASTYTTCKAMTDLMQGLKQHQSTAPLMHNMLTFEQFNNLIGLPEIRQHEAEYVI